MTAAGNDDSELIDVALSENDQPVSVSSSSSSAARNNRKSGVTNNVSIGDITSNYSNLHYEDQAEEDDDPAVWTKRHQSIGLQVAANFKVNRRDQLFIGEISEYCPPSARGKHDQLYHVRWEDGDECDYDEADFQKGRKLYLMMHHGDSSVHSSGGSSSHSKKKRTSNTTATAAKKKSHHNNGSSKNAKKVLTTAADSDGAGWTEEHPSVGTHVAQYFGQENKAVLYHGKVVKCAPETKEGAGDQFYHVEWEDGDECDFEESDYQAAVALYAEKGHHPSHALLDENLINIMNNKSNSNSVNNRQYSHNNSVHSTTLCNNLVLSETAFAATDEKDSFAGIGSMEVDGDYNADGKEIIPLLMYT
jgi:hypothetical protein